MANAFRAMVDYVQGILSTAEAPPVVTSQSPSRPGRHRIFLSHNFIRVHDTLDKLIKEFQRLIHGAQQGNLQGRGQAGQFQGAYHDLVQSLNTMLDAIIAPIAEAATVLDHVAARDLRARVCQAYHGDFAAIKQALNTAVTNLDNGFVQVATGTHRLLWPLTSCVTIATR